MVGNPDWATQPKEVMDLKTDYNLVKLMERTQNTDTDTQIHTHIQVAMKMICGQLDKLKIKNGHPSESLEASSSVLVLSSKSKEDDSFMKNVLLRLNCIFLGL